MLAPLSVLVSLLAVACGAAYAAHRARAAGAAAHVSDARRRMAEGAQRLAALHAALREETEVQEPPPAADPLTPEQARTRRRRTAPRRAPARRPSAPTDLPS